MKTIQDLSILFWLWKKRADSTGKAPIYVRLSINKTRIQFALGHKVIPTLFNTQSGLVKGNSDDAKTINNHLILVKGKLQQHFNSLITQHEVVTPEMVRNAYLGKKEVQKTLVYAFKWHNDQFEQKVKAGNRAPASLEKFKTTLDKITAFLKAEFNLSDIPLPNIKHSFAEDFEHYLTITEKLQNNSAMKHIRNTKKVLWMCVQKDWLSKNPIQEFRCSYHSPDRERLMKDELDRLISKEMPLKRLEEVRDTYVAMCFTGYAYKDASILSKDHIHIMIDGQRWFMKNRIKTECKENVPIFPIVEEIIERYKDHPFCVRNNKVFPINSNQKFNAYLKEIAAICQINKNLTTHTARHTFATTVTLSNGVPIETVSALLGHNSIRTTQIYAKIVAQKVSDDMGMLKQKLQQASINLTGSKLKTN